VIDIASLPAAALQTAPAAADPSASGLVQTVVLMGGMLAIVYFVLIRPEKKRQADHRKMLGALQKGDRVLTTGGIYGTVASIQDDEVTLKIDESQNVRVRVARSAVSNVLREGAETSTQDAKATSEKK
jgi:preprotein translocase subunit YajC